MDDLDLKMSLVIFGDSWQFEGKWRADGECGQRVQRGCIVI